MINKKIRDASCDEISAEYVFGDVKKVKDIRREIYLNNAESNADCLIYDFRQEDYDAKKLGLANRLALSEKRRKKVLNKKVNTYSNVDNCFFITLTFKDEFFIGKSKDTIRTYIRRYLKENCNNYVANEDYGTKNERLHFHCVCNLKSKDILTDFGFHTYKNHLLYCANLKNYDFGFSVVEKVKKATQELASDIPNNHLALSNYINKLTNHALKNTGRPPRIIYSRKTQINVKKKSVE